MTARQRLIQQTIELGIRLSLELGLELGILFGVLFGIQVGKRESLLQVLRLRFGTAVDAEIEHRVWEASVEQLEAWIDRLLSAGTLTELMETCSATGGVAPATPLLGIQLEDCLDTLAPRARAAARTLAELMKT